MDDRHPTYPARTGAAGVLVWIAFVIAVAGVIGFIVTVAISGV
ncbi:hypothetical protein [Planctomonas sp. JC2975]|nr:hypothetical protein [Planctomonas sp. JC2975]